VTLYDTASGMERGRLQAKSEWILFAGWIDNNQRIVTGDVTGKLRFFLYLSIRDFAAGKLNTSFMDRFAVAPKAGSGSLAEAS